MHSLNISGRLLVVLTFIAVFISSLDAQIDLLKPTAIVGHELGGRFTLHHAVSDYSEHVHEAVSGSQLIRYGESFEGRPLELLVLSSAANLQNIENIRAQHLDRMRGGTGIAEYDDLAIIWLSYNVHGNEAACTEAALKVMHDLGQAALDGEDFLDHVVVLLDPCLNPDGHDRYAVWFNQFASNPPNSDPNAFEHDEPWPGGRPNHYLFDLNRDWAWQKQQESQMRSAVYHQWMPHVHCDYHEMGYNSPYYFAPAAEPYHESITPWQRTFQDEVGQATAEAFDARGELYYTKESFDLLYPSYGDTYPMFNGAIGMTYEQGGSGGAGVLVKTSQDQLLSLNDRIANHVESSLEAVYTTARLAEKLVDEWGAYYDRNRTQPIGRFGGYLIPKTEDNSARIERLVKFLDRHGVTSESMTSNQKSVTGWEYGVRQKRSVKPKEGDLVISAYQTHSGILGVLFDPDPVLTDSLTYDITTWSAPFAYGLRTFGLDAPLNGAPHVASNIKPVQNEAFGYAFARTGDQDSPLMAQLLHSGFRLRTNAKSFESNGSKHEAGTILVLRGDHKGRPQWWSELSELATEHGVHLDEIAGGFSDAGPDMGSDDVWAIQAPRIGALTGPGVSSLGAGEVWWHFEQELHYPVTMLSAQNSNPLEWAEFDVIVLPSGWYSNANDSWLESLGDWVRDGGRLIVLSGAMRLFEGESGWGLNRFDDDTQEDQVRLQSSAEKASDRQQAYDERQRLSAMRIGDGSIYPVQLDRSHPLAWGYPDTPYYTLRSNSSRFALLNNGWNVGTFGSETEAVSGFVGTRANRQLDESFVFGSQPMGRGSVVYFSDNPLFRGFWENGKLMFDNAVFLNVN